MSVRPPQAPKPHHHFTPFYSAADEAASAQERTDEGGSTALLRGCIVYTPTVDLAYKVLLIHRGRADSEHLFATMREAEAFIRRRTPLPAPPLSKLYDRNAGES